MTDISAEYYRSHPGGILHRATHRHRPPACLHLGQPEARRRALSRKTIYAGVEAGRTFFEFPAKISTELCAPKITHWRLTTGFGGGPYLSVPPKPPLPHQTGQGSSGIVSPNGFRLVASAGALYHAAGSSNAPLVMLSTARTWLGRETQTSSA